MSYRSNEFDDMMEMLLPKLRRWALPVLAALILLIGFFSGGMGLEEIQPGEVAVLYNTTGLSIFGDDHRVIREQGTIVFMPWFQRIETLDTSPQILIMEGGEEKEKDVDPNHAKKLTVRANDGSNFFFPKLEIHYQLNPALADVAIATHGRGDRYKWMPVKASAREILRNKFGGYSFMEAANPGNYAKATTLGKVGLNLRLNPLAIDITQVITPKPTFDPAVEKAIQDRQHAEQAVPVLAKKRESLEQRHDRLIQDVKEKKNAEFQGLVAKLSADLQKVKNTLVDVKRDADQYGIAKLAEGNGRNVELTTKAKANEEAARERAQGLAAKISAVGALGPDVLNLTIAQYTFPQMQGLKASPFYQSATPFVMHTTTGDKP